MMDRILLSDKASIKNAGVYVCKEVVVDNFIDIIRKRNGRIISYIGRRYISEYLTGISGVEAGVKKRNSVYKDGDIIMIIRHDGRIYDEDRKREYRAEDKDFRYYIVEYKDERSLSFNDLKELFSIIRDIKTRRRFSYE